MVRKGERYKEEVSQEKKRPYQKPTVTSLGSLSQVTQGFGVGFMDGGVTSAY